MTKQTTSRWRRALVSGLASAGMVVSLMVGFGSATAHADVLDDLAQEYGIGAGAGKVANLVRTSLELRAQGFRPKAGDYQAITDSLRYRPNQGPLIEALSAAVAGQQRSRHHAAGAGGQPPIQVGVIHSPFDPGNPMERNSDSVFPMPGR